VLYVLSVAAIVVSVNGVVALVSLIFLHQATAGVYAATTLATLGLIALGSAEIIARLSRGHRELAILLSGRPIGRGTGSDDERRLINIVDEMAIASGLPAPPLFVMHREPGINAFAAGLSPSQAVVVVTQGALERLSRDELQAVIAHEFSHILNGDIRLNLRAVYVLQGIVFLSAIGRFMVQYYSGAGTEEGRRFFHLPFALVGVGLFAVGSVGLLFCRIIQASISRERENLADASAVRYTRNADALCGALARIQMNARGSRLLNWHGDALAHMLFAPGTSGWLRSLVATHPPIEERMRRINPHVSPAFYFEQAEKPRVTEEKKKEAAPPGKQKPQTIVPRRLTDVAALVAAIGEPGAEHLEYASGLLAYLAPSIREALGDPIGAQAVMIGCVMDADLQARELQLNALQALKLPDLARKADVLRQHLEQLDRAYRLPPTAYRARRAGAQRPGQCRARCVSRRAARHRGRRPARHAQQVRPCNNPRLDPRPESAPCRRRAVQGAWRACRRDRAGALDARVRRRGCRRSRGRASRFRRRPRDAGAAGARPLRPGCLARAVACALDCPMPPTVAALDPRLLRK